MRSRVTSLLVSLLIPATGLLAGERTVDPKLSVPLFLKIITYDTNFKPEQFKKVELHLLYDKSDAVSYNQLQQIEDYFRDHPNLKISEVEIGLHVVNHDEIDAALDQLSYQNYNVLIATNMANVAFDALASKLRQQSVRSFSLNPDHVTLGLAVSVRAGEKNNAILVNLDASRDEGSRFSAHLLKMCEIFKE